jgi:hypothetical protein
MHYTQNRLFVAIGLLGLLFPAWSAAHQKHPLGPGLLDASGAAHDPSSPGASSDLRWWKGNLHTHTLWSDGNDYPEMVVDWYKENGYHFLGLSDHNILSHGQKWVSLEHRRAAAQALPRYIERFGEAWVEVREVDESLREKLAPLPDSGPTHSFEARRPPDEQLQDGAKVVRLKPLEEFRHLFEEPDRFLMIQSVEVNDARVVHINQTNILEYIPAQGGRSTLEIMQNNVDAVFEQRQRTGRPMFPHINHPNFAWAITGEELAAVERVRFFEVYNGHRSVRNYGDDIHVGLDRMWDIVLTLRLDQLDLGVIYGLAVDDAHDHQGRTNQHSSPGRGWVMVRAAFLTPEHIIAAMERGDFYSSTGVTINDVRFDGSRYELEIEPEEGVTYVTQFIGTRSGYDPSSEPVRDEEGNPLNVTRRYSDDIGGVLAEVEGIHPGYELSGDEIYVRAKVISSKVKENPYQEGEKEMAWTQPIVPAAVDR